MGVVLRQENSGIVFKVYQSKNDFDEEKQSLLIEDSSKDFRQQKTFKKKLSAKERRALEVVGNQILNDYNGYMILYRNGLGSQFVVEKLQLENKYKLDEIQIKSIYTNQDILFDIFFNRKSNLEIDTLKQQYGLDEFDLLLALVGTFGYGKTTLIKKFLKLPEKYVFPLVDNGRTTISPSVLRGLLVYNEGNEKYIIKRNTISDKTSNNIEIKKIPLKEYEFLNVIYLEDFDLIYYNVIAENLQKAFLNYYKNKDILKALKVFISNDKCNLDELFGDIEDCKKNEFYKVLISEFDKEIENINDDVDIEFINNEVLLNAFKEYCSSKVKEIVNEINDKTDRNDIIIKDSEIKFGLKVDQIKDFNKYYEYFSSNKDNIRGKGLRILVKKTYTEVDFDINNFNDGQNNIIKPSDIVLDKEGYYKYDSFVFVDTMGCAHVSEENQESDMNMDSEIINNSALLNESDIILLLENASKTMSNDVKSQFFTLENLGYRNKIIICYSHYNQFIKEDIRSDKEREEELKKNFKFALSKLYSKNINKANRIYEDFSDNDSQIVYLKGLVPRADIKVNHEEDDERECSDEEAMTQQERDNLKAHKLNEGIEKSRKCLVELIEKIISLNEYSKEQMNNSFTIKENSKDLDFTINYSQTMYKDFSKNFLNKEYKIYGVLVPAHNTSAALCRNAYFGNAYFDGAMLLQPLNDVIAEGVYRFNEFLDNYFQLTLVQNDDGDLVDKALNEDFLIDMIKSLFSQKIHDYFQCILVDSQKSKWKQLSLDNGTGVKKRRSNGIYNLIKQSFDMPSLSKEILEYIFASISEIVDAYGI